MIRVPRSGAVANGLPRDGRTGSQVRRERLALISRRLRNLLILTAALAQLPRRGRSSRLLLAGAAVAVSLGVLFGAEAGSAETAVAAAGPPSNIAAPVISGTALVGQTLTVNPGSWSGTSPITYTFYAWRRCDSAGENCTLVSNASSLTY